MAGQQQKAPIPRAERQYLTIPEIRALHGVELPRASRDPVLAVLAENGLDHLYGYESDTRKFYKLCPDLGS
jgi:hypothetical protein